MLIRWVFGTARLVRLVRQTNPSVEVAPPLCYYNRIQIIARLWIRQECVQSEIVCARYRANHLIADMNARGLVLP